MRLVLLIYNRKIAYILAKNQHRRRFDVGVKSKTNIPTAELQEWHTSRGRIKCIDFLLFERVARYNTLGL